MMSDFERDYLALCAVDEQKAERYLRSKPIDYLKELVGHLCGVKYELKTDGEESRKIDGLLELVMNELSEKCHKAFDDPILIANELAPLRHEITAVSSAAKMNQNKPV